MMGRCFYRLSDTPDPEERLEDAALAKALHDVLGRELRILGPDATFPGHGLHLGRGRRGEGAVGQKTTPLSPDLIRYWEDPAFRRHASRDWGLFDLEGAEAEVARLHESGRDAVVKSTLSSKHMITGAPRGTSLVEALDAMVYSFVDRGPCLLVQERVDMRYERRFLILNREVVTQSAVGARLTPLSRFSEPGPGQAFEDLHLLTPDAERMVHIPLLTDRMTRVACEIAETSGFEHLCVDLCLIGEDPVRGVIEPVEYNPMQPGMLGLYGCDPYRVAEGVRSHLEANPNLYRSGPYLTEGDLEEIPFPDDETPDADWLDLDG